MSHTDDLRRLLTSRWQNMLDAAVALVLTLTSVGAVADAADATGLTLVDGVPVDTAWLMARAVPIWWAFTASLITGLLIRRRWPLPALILAGLGGAGHWLDLYEPNLFPRPVDLIVPIVVFTLSSGAATRRVSMIASGVLLATAYVTGVAAAAVRAPSPTNSTGDHLTEVLAAPLGMATPALTAVVVAFALGDAVRSRRAHLRTVNQRTADLKREQLQRAALATAAERAQIARELHDVLAHSLSVIVAQAQAAAAAQHKYPDRTAAAINEVITVGRASLTEMRHLLGVFRADPLSDGLAPQPGLGTLDELFDRVRAAGIDVRLDIHGNPATLPAGTDLSAYRIVQEALTNILKHAHPGAQAAVSLALRPDHLDIEVTDDGAGQAVERMTTRHGNGLRGMAERVSLLGGTLTAGPGPVTGFLVQARLPITPPEPVSSTR